MELLSAIVKENWDEENKGKVKVEYPVGETGVMVTGWIPVTVPYAGPGYGIYMLPEIGSEVIVGFLDGKKNNPVVLGSLLHTVNAIPEDTADENNDKKLIQTKAGFKILIDEAGKKLSVSNPDGTNTISMTDGEEEKIVEIEAASKILLKINGKEKMAVEEEVVTITGKTVINEKVTVEDDIAIAGGDVTVTGDNVTIGPDTKLEMKSGQIIMDGSTKTEIKGKQLSVSGDMGEIKTNANMTVEAGGIMNVKGKMLNLN